VFESFRQALLFHIVSALSSKSLLTCLSLLEHPAAPLSEVQSAFELQDLWLLPLLPLSQMSYYHVED
jgi:hypothetical protein